MTISSFMSRVVCAWPRCVHVRSYVRFRLGRFEHVREHCRSLPGYKWMQLNLGL